MEKALGRPQSQLSVLFQGEGGRVALRYYPAGQCASAHRRAERVFEVSGGVSIS